MYRCTLAGSLVIVLFLAPGASVAQVVGTWNVNAAGNWSVAGNWSGGVPTAAGDTAVFGNIITAARTVTVDVPVTLGTMAFDDNNNYLVALGAGSLTFDDGGAGNAAVTITNLAGNGAHSISSAFALADNLDISQGSTGTFTISGLISGAGNITKTGTGLLSLTTATNTFVGNWTINQGAVLINADARLGDAANDITLNGGSLQNATTFTLGGGRVITLGASNGTINQTAGTLTLATANQLTGTGNLNKIGAGTLSLTAAQDFVGNWNITGGAVLINGDDRLGDAANDITLNGGSLQNATSFTLGSGRMITLGASNGTINQTAGTLTLGAANQLTGAGNLTKAGAGVLALTAAQDFTGTTTITGGVLRTDDGTGLPTGSLLTLNGGVFETGINLARTGGAGAGNMRITGGASGFSAYGGPVQVAFGALASPTDLTWGTAPFAPASLVLNAAAANNTLEFLNAIDLNGAARTVTVNANTATMSGLLTGAGASGLVKGGAGTLVLSGSNTYAGATTINGGVLSVSTLADGGTNSGIGASSSIADNLVLNGGTLQYTGAGASSDRLFTLGTTAGSAINASGSGALNLTNTGSIVLSGTNVARTFTLTGSNTDNNTLAAVLANNGTGVTSLTKSGAGTWVLSGANTYTGTTTLAAGTLAVGDDSALGSGTLNVTGVTTLRPAGASRSLSNAVTLGNNLTVSGSYDLAIGGTLTNSAASRTLTNSLDPGNTLTLANVNLSNDATGRTLTVTGAGDTTITGAIVNGGAGAGSLTKTGTGTLLLSGANTYTGTTTVGAGTLRLGAAGALYDSGTVNVTGGTFDLGGFTETIGQITTMTSGSVVNSGGAAQLILNNAGNTLTATGANTISADVQLNTAVALTRTFSPTAALDSLTISGVLSEGSAAAGVTKAGLGTVLLSGANTYTGTTTLTAGTLAVGNDSALGSGTLNVTGVTTLRPDGANRNLANAVTLGSNLTVSGSYGLAIGGTLTNSAGNRTLTNSLDPGNTLTLANVNLSNDATGRTLTITGAGDTTITGAIVNGGAGAGSLTKTGTGTLLLSGANTYTGTTTAGGGTLRLGAAGVLYDSGTVSVTGGGTFDLAGFTETIGQLATMTNGSVVNTGGAAQLILSNAGNTLTATGASAISADVQLNTAAALTRTFSPTAALDSLTISGVLSEGSAAAGVTKAGLGTLLLSGANTYTGTTTLAAGTLAVGNDGALGSGTLSVTGVTTLRPDIANRNLANAVTLGSNLTVSGSFDLALGGTLTNSAGNRTLTNSLDPGNTLTLSSVSLSNDATGRTLTIAGTGDTTVTGAIVNGGAGAGGLTKIGTGTLLLSGANTYTGTTTVGAGTLRLGAAGVLYDSGTVSVTGGGTFDLAGFTETIGQLATMTNGSIVNGGGAAQLILSGANSTLTATGANTINADVQLNTTVARTRTFALTGAGDSLAISGVLSEGSAAASLSKTGAGTLVLSGANTYTGTTTVGAGTLRLGAAGVLYDSGTVNVTGGGTFDLAGFTETIGRVTTMTNGSIVNTGGAAQLILSGAGNTLTATGASTISADVQLNTAAALTRTFAVTNAVDSLTISGVLSEGSAAASLSKSGLGTLLLSGTNTYTGTTTLIAGTLAVGNDSALGTGALSVTGAATLRPNGADRNLSNAVTLGSNLTVSGSYDLALGGTLTNSGGNRTLTNSLDPGDTLTLANVNLSNNATGRTLTVTGAGDTTITGAIANGGAGAGSLVKSGTGTLLLSGPNTYTGTTTINDGTLLLDGTHTAGAGGDYQVNVNGTFGGIGTTNRDVSMGGGILTPGDTGVGSLATGNVDFLTAGSILSIDIDGATADLLAIVGDLRLDAGMILDFNVAAEPTAPIYTIATYTGAIVGASGQFDTELDTPSGYEVRYRTHSIELALVPEPSTLAMGVAALVTWAGFVSRRRVFRRRSR